MSFLDKLSVFYYGTTSEKTNNNLDFSEGGPELTAVISVDDYTLEQYGQAVADAMTLAGSQTYSYSINRANRKITISAASNFSLLSLSGSHAGTSPWDLLGFTTVSDKTGANTYTSQNGVGFEYRPQLILDNYVQLEDYEVKESAVVNQSVSGVVQTLQFGDGQRMSCNIRGASDLTGLKITPFYENASGVQDLRNFMKYLITKAKVEFMPDESARSTFFNLILESTPADKSGVKFQIKNMKGANRFFETGNLLFRKAIE